MEPLLSVIPAQAGIQIGGSTAKAQRRKGDFWVPALAALFTSPCSVAAGALNQVTPLRLCAFAVNRRRSLTNCPSPRAPAFAGVT